MVAPSQVHAPDLILISVRKMLIKSAPLAWSMVNSSFQRSVNICANSMYSLPLAIGSVLKTIPTASTEKNNEPQTGGIRSNDPTRYASSYSSRNVGQCKRGKIVWTEE